MLYTINFLKEEEMINVLIVNKIYYKNYRMIRKKNFDKITNTQSIC